MMRGATRASLVALALTVMGPAGALALPEDPGAVKYTKSTLLKGLGGKQTRFDLYVPQPAKPAPAVVLGHGFARSRVQMQGWAKLLASKGYVAAALDFPGPVPNHKLNGQLMSALLGWLVAEGKKTTGTLAGKVDSGRLGVMGHSAGGLASVLAAANNKQVRVVVGLDPVDLNNLGKQSAAAVKVPATVLLAEPGTCNSNGNGAGIYSNLGGPKFTLKVTKATHCDPEWNSGVLCTIACGATDPKRQARFRRYALATLDHVLRCAGDTAPWLGGASAKADSLVKSIASAKFPPKQLGCGAVPDAGVPDVGTPDAAPTPDSAASKDSSRRDTGAADGAAPDSGKGDAGAPAAEEPGGCSCTVERPGSPGVLALPGLLLALVLARRRRRRTA